MILIYGKGNTFVIQVGAFIQVDAIHFTRNCLEKGSTTTSKVRYSFFFFESLFLFLTFQAVQGQPVVHHF